MLEQYNQFFKWWVHPKIQANVQYDQLGWQALITQLIANGGHVSILTLGFVFNYQYAIYSGCLGLLFSTSIVLLLRYVSYFPLLSYLSCAQFILVLFVASYGDGGVWSFYSIYYILLIWWTYYYGQSVGNVFSFSLMIWLLFWTWKEYNGFSFPDAMPPDSRYAFRAIYISMALSVYITVFWLANKNEKRIRQKLDQSRQQLIKQEKMASLGQLTAGIAHEINNPINFVNGSSEALMIDIRDVQLLLNKITLLEKTPQNSHAVNELIELSQELDLSFLQKEINELVGNIKEGGDRVTEIVKGLITFTHQSEGPFVRENIIAILDSAIIVLDNKLKSKNIGIHKNIQEIPKVPCLGGKLSQVFVNIIDNAIEAMDMEGILIFQVAQDQENVTIKIKDNGKGMDATTQKRIFEPFFTTKEVGKGTGLGMAISYGIIKDHGGDILVESKKGEGTAMTIILPIEKIS